MLFLRSHCAELANFKGTVGFDISFICISLVGTSATLISFNIFGQTRKWKNSHFCTVNQIITVQKWLTGTL